MRIRLAIAGIVLGLVLGAISCSNDKKATSGDDAYIQQIQQWHQERLARLKKPDGWLSLVGLYWPTEGENRFGSDSSNGVVFPPKAPPHMGTLLLKDNSVTLSVQPGVEITVDGKPVRKMVVYREGMEKPVIMQHGSLSWFIIKRGTKLGVRLRDSENPKIAALKSIDYYPIDPVWRIPAHFEPYPEPKQIAIENILGMVEKEPSPGQLVFEWKGKPYRLETLEEGDELFVIVHDKTSGEETYGLGRYLYVKKPAPGETVWLDFNKAYNPPCAFTDYATCPLPPPQNHLPFPITAGEKYSGEGH